MFIQENAFQNGICELVSILFWPQYVKGGLHNIYLVNKTLTSMWSLLVSSTNNDGPPNKSSKIKTNLIQMLVTIL